MLLHKLATAENPEKHIDEYSKIVDLLSRLNHEINHNQKLRDDSRRTLGREYDPVRVREDNEIDMLEQERYSTPGPNPKNRDATTPFLHPLPMSTVKARDNEYDRQQRALQFQEHSLNLLKLTTERAKAKTNRSLLPPPRKCENRFKSTGHGKWPVGAQ